MLTEQVTWDHGAISEIPRVALRAALSTILAKFAPTWSQLEQTWGKLGSYLASTLMVLVQLDSDLASTLANLGQIDSNMAPMSFDLAQLGPKSAPFWPHLGLLVRRPPTCENNLNFRSNVQNPEKR